MPIFIGTIKSSTVQHGGSFNIPTFTSNVTAHSFSQKFNVSQFNTGDFNPSLNNTGIFDPDAADNATLQPRTW